MTFEEQFPELKDQELLSLSMHFETDHKTVFKKSNGYETVEGIKQAYAETDIEKFCLSKSKVKEALRELGGTDFCDMPLMQELLRELGLEDD